MGRLFEISERLLKTCKKPLRAIAAKKLVSPFLPSAQIPLAMPRYSHTAWFRGLFEI